MSISKLKMQAMMMATLLASPPVGQLQAVTPATEWSHDRLPSNVRLRTGSTKKVSKTKRRAKAKAARIARRAQR